MARYLGIVAALVMVSAPPALADAQAQPDLAKAVKLFNNFQNKKAAALLQKVLKHDPSPDQAAKAHVYLGLIALNGLKADKAKAQFKQALTIDATLELPFDASPKARLAFEQARRDVEREAQQTAVRQPPSPSPSDSEPPAADATPAQPAPQSAPIIVQVQPGKPPPPQVVVVTPDQPAATDKPQEAPKEAKTPDGSAADGSARTVEAKPQDAPDGSADKAQDKPVEVTLEPPPGSRTQGGDLVPPVKPAASNGPNYSGAITMTVLGGIAGIGGGVLGLLANASLANANSNLTSPDVGQAKTYQTQAGTEGLIADICFGVGAIGLLTAGIIFVAEAASGGGSSSPPVHADAKGLAIQF